MQAVGKIHDKDKTEESHREEEKDKQGSQERVQLCCLSAACP